MRRAPGPPPRKPDTRQAQRKGELMVVALAAVLDDAPGHGRRIEVAGDVLLEDDDLRVVRVVRLVEEIELNAHAFLLVERKALRHPRALPAVPPRLLRESL